MDSHSSQIAAFISEAAQRLLDANVARVPLYHSFVSTTLQPDSPKRSWLGRRVSRRQEGAKVEQVDEGWVIYASREGATAWNRSGFSTVWEAYSWQEGGTWARDSYIGGIECRAYPVFFLTASGDAMVAAQVHEAVNKSADPWTVGNCFAKLDFGNLGRQKATEGSQMMLRYMPIHLTGRPIRDLPAEDLFRISGLGESWGFYGSALVESGEYKLEQNEVAERNRTTCDQQIAHWKLGLQRVIELSKNG